MCSLKIIIAVVFLSALIYLEVDSKQLTTVKLGNWSYYAHGCKGGQVTILDKKRIQIENFHYDGRGPEAWFQIGVKSGKNNVPYPCANHRKHPIIPDDKGQCAKKPKSYTRTKLILTIPDQYRWEDIDYLGLYCYKYQHLFGFVKIPYFNTSRLLAAKTKMNPCTAQQRRILADSTSPVKCGLEKPWNTTGGSFP